MATTYGISHYTTHATWILKKTIFYDIIQWCATNKEEEKTKRYVGILVPLWIWARSPYIDHAYL